MKELQKYYAIDLDTAPDHRYSEVYLASEADAAFAALKQQHAEEVSKLRAQVRSLNKQAERYEKLKAAGLFELGKFRQSNLSFDEFVDKLP